MMIGDHRAGTMRTLRLRPVAMPRALGLGLAIGVVAGAVAAFVPALGVVILAALLVGLLTVRHPDVATVVGLAAVYSNAAVVATTFYHAPAFVAAAIPGLFLVPLAHRVFVRGEPLVVTPALPFVALYLGVQVLAAMASPYPGTAFDEVARFVGEGLLLFVLVTNVLTSARMIRLAVWTLLIVGAVLAAMSFYQAITGQYGNVFLGFAQVGDTGVATGEITATGEETLQARASGPIGEKNRYAQILAVLIPLGLSLAAGERARVLRATAIALSALVAIGMALTFSRGAAVGVAITVLIALLLGYVRRPAAIAGIALAAVVFVAVPVYGQRLATLESATGPEGDTSVAQRLNDIHAGVLMVSDHPVLGVGPGVFPLLYRDYAGRAEGLAGTRDFEAHNLFVDVAAETGLLGLGLWGVAVGVTMFLLARARRRLKPQRPALAWLATGCFLAMTAYLATGLFLHLSYARYFWLLLAVAASVAWVVVQEEHRLRGRSV
jgi:putative inorganic carbon (hco3(-)) transporter